jgi:hypothetical protein
MEREEDLRYRWLSPPQIKLQGHLRRQPTVPRGTTSSLEELDMHAHQKVENPNSGAIESTRRSSTIESGE